MLFSIGLRRCKCIIHTKMPILERILVTFIHSIFVLNQPELFPKFPVLIMGAALWGSQITTPRGWLNIAAQVTDEPMWFSHGTPRPNTIFKPVGGVNDRNLNELKWMVHYGFSWTIMDFWESPFRESTKQHLVFDWNIYIYINDINGDRTTLTSTVRWYWLFFGYQYVFGLIPPNPKMMSNGFHSMRIRRCLHKNMGDTCRYQRWTSQNRRFVQNRHQARAVLSLTLTWNPNARGFCGCSV